MSKYSLEEAIENHKENLKRIKEGGKIVKKRINITIHKLELEKLDRIAKENNETRSGMITRLIQQQKI